MYVVLKLLRSVLLGTCGGFVCTTGVAHAVLLASCTPVGALLAAYVVLKLLRHALLETRVGFMYTRRCLASWDTNSALLCYGCYASPCSLHTCEYSVGIHRCWMLAQACYVRVSTLGIRLSMTLRGLLRRLGYACCCSL